MFEGVCVRGTDVHTPGIKITKNLRMYSLARGVGSCASIRSQRSHDFPKCTRVGILPGLCGTRDVNGSPRWEWVRVERFQQLHGREKNTCASMACMMHNKTTALPVGLICVSFSTTHHTHQFQSLFIPQSTSAIHRTAQTCPKCDQNVSSENRGSSHARSR